MSPENIRLISVSVLLVALLGTSTYYFFFKPSEPPAIETPSPEPPAPQPSPVPPPPPPGPQPPPSPTPTPVVSIADTRTIVATAVEEAALSLHDFLAIPPASGALVSLLLKVESAEENRYLSFDEVLTALGVTLPVDVRDELAPLRFTLVAYGEPNVGQARIGFITDVSDTSALRNALLRWEAIMPEDFAPLLQDLGEVGNAASDHYLTSTREGLTIRYMNFPGPTIATDYAVDSQRKLFLFATSRAQMYALVDLLATLLPIPEVET